MRGHWETAKEISYFQRLTRIIPIFLVSLISQSTREPTELLFRTLCPAAESTPATASGPFSRGEPIRYEHALRAAESEAVAKP